MSDTQQSAYTCLLSGDFDRAVNLYEEAITLEPQITSNYAYLGLAMLLQGRESEAQMVWFNAIDDVEEFDDWLEELEKILNTEAERYTNQLDTYTAWLLRQHLAEISPQNLYNLIELARLCSEKPLLDPDETNLCRLLEVLEDYSYELSEIEVLALKNLVNQSILNAPHKDLSKSFDTSAIRKLSFIQRNQSIVNISADEIKNSIAIMQIYLQKLERPQRAEAAEAILLTLSDLPKPVEIIYIKVLLDFFPSSIKLLARLIDRLQSLHFYLESVKFALQITAVRDQKTIYQIYGYCCATLGFLDAGLRWQEAQDMYSKCCQLIQTLLLEEQKLNIFDALGMAGYGICLFRLNDTPASNHTFLGKVGTYFQSEIRRLFGGVYFSPNNLGRLANQSKKLKIGYISEYLCRNSVGWISRWLFFNHDLEKFDVFAYSLKETNDEVQLSIKNAVTSFDCLTVDSDDLVTGIKEIVSRIQRDEIDILIDLDSLSVNVTCVVMALKPAPIQITWLGSDASGIPAIDYFIADPYVLPDNAQSYYTSKIWRLPYTYVAVNGFEVGIPDLRRTDLGIPQDAIIYLSVQAPHKRHPEVLRQQMQILQQVPNSYFLIKSTEKSIDFEDQVVALALQEGISSERLRFLPNPPAEAVHRANYAIADVILDTYPYNGATTTLEALWMELPIVTRVGEQFVARNSYTMMINAGITEGIAWTDEEYIEWGVKLGNDADLRKQISWKLKKSKQTSPLWDAKQFAREMELAYEQMWEIIAEID
jgi:predicted O-linked N-acetylglucosamine transferase (SPINDLY family)